jgi:hypothetical protein
MAQVCRWQQRGGRGVCGTTEEAKDEQMRSRSNFVIHGMISHHWHGHKAQISRNIKNHYRHTGLETATKGE